MVREIDKSQYSPTMENTACFVMGFANRGEAYQPQEFTSRTAWLNYYGEPDTEAERYFYAAACEVLNQSGRLYCARLPYDNVSFEKVAAFKYTVDTHNSSGYSIADTSSDVGRAFNAVYREDDSVDVVAKIVPAKAATVYDLSAIDEYRTDEARVPANTFLIADVAFNCYNRIPEDAARKEDDRELIGIMPVVTTAANAMLAQGLISARNVEACNYETIGAIRTLNAGATLDGYPAAKELLPSDCAKMVNSRDHYQFVTTAQTLSSNTFAFDLATFGISQDDLDAGTAAEKAPLSALRRMARNELLSSESASAHVSAWNGQIQATFPADVVGRISVDTSFTVDVAIGPEDSRWGWHGVTGDDDLPETVSFEANEYFPTISLAADENGDLRFERDSLKKIGLVVYKMYLDPSEGNKVSFEPVEAYAGSLGRDDKDPNTGVTTFMDTIVNSQSQYVNFFSNCFSTKTSKKFYTDTLDMLVVEPPKQQDESVRDVDRSQFTAIDDKLREIYDNRNGVGSYDADIAGRVGSGASYVGAMQDLIDDLDDGGASLDEEIASELDTARAATELLASLAAADTPASAPVDATTPSLGFYWSMVKEDISIDKSIYDGINKCFAKVEDINERAIDIVCDAGVANIASYLKAIYGNKGEYDLAICDDLGNSLLGMWKCNSNNAAVRTWKAVEQKYDDFCKNTRKDCMFIADGLRPLVLAGQKKVIRPTKPTNTIDSQILPYVKYLTGLNTSYGAGYIDWFEQADDYSGDFFWCPPSIKAMGIYLNTDANFMYWDAPAGLNRGVVTATDVAFSPTMAQAGAIYEKNWNYAINYPQDGIVLEGQKTFQVKPSAFDRVNVRRLFLRLER